jgi:hypothetical protein
MEDEGTPGKPPTVHSVAWNALLPSAEHCTNVLPAGKAAFAGMEAATITAAKLNKQGST